jgi:hypothetical protein
VSTGSDVEKGRLEPTEMALESKVDGAGKSLKFEKYNEI